MTGPGPRGERIYVERLVDGSLEWNYCRAGERPASGKALGWFQSITDAKAFIRMGTEGNPPGDPQETQGELL